MPPIFLQVKIWRNELYCRVWSCFAIWSPFPGSLEIDPLLPCRHARQSGRLHRSQAIFAAEEEVGEQCACHRTGQVQMCPHFMEYDSEASSLPWTWHLDTFLVPFIENQQWQSDGLDSSKWSPWGNLDRTRSNACTTFFHKSGEHVAWNWHWIHYELLSHMGPI